MNLTKPTRIRNEARLEFVRQMPCLISEFASLDRHVCQQWWDFDRHKYIGPSAQAHHVRKGSNSGIGTKPSDFRTVPLCRVAHDEYHRIGHDTFCAKYGLSLEEHIQRINHEFQKTQRKPQCERKKPTGLRIVKALKAWAVVSPTGHIQTIHCGRSQPRALPHERIVRVEIREVRKSR